MITALTLSLITLQLAPLPKAPMATLKLADSKGVERTIPANSKATVLLFVATDCPIANRMAPELSRIVTKYQRKGISFAFIYVDPSQKPAQIQHHLKEYKLTAPGILDNKHRVVKAMGATVTPQAVILNRAGAMVYRGRINDLFLEHGRARKAPKTEDLRIALDQMLAGKPVQVSQTAALGCSIPPLD
jgi:thiol-disulfide isomerase/thioredoxin